MRTLALAVIASSLLAACSRPRVAVYDAPKDEASAPLAEAAPPPPPADAPSLAWTAPAGWTQRTGTGMRVATLVPPAAPGAELSVVRLAGNAGGELANVNRWRGQLGLPPVDGLKEARSVETSAGRALLVDLRAPDGRAMLAAILQDGDTCWFFKLTGPSSAVSGAASGFDSLIGSLRHVGP